MREGRDACDPSGGVGNVASVLATALMAGAYGGLDICGSLSPQKAISESPLAERIGEGDNASSIISLRSNRSHLKSNSAICDGRGRREGTADGRELGLISDRNRSESGGLSVRVMKGEL